ncbi:MULTISPECIES: HAMP domain-containing sensor histidine kinase [Paenibacillus]|uniref:histidine kinase n=1 Tax=Paenibacillus odorifer TaxID=189426 RepID=A0A1R0WU85_9BACL|nr:MULTISPECIES: HAMP domain-containing sensor histidine kinase [Paenibacillus]ETT66031.1 sensor histidine kinase [Paenibacillus sp. FSL H8-237]OMD21436.1 two-component sensor histidine kinase [Paenibacillus odorifer]OMD28239.1 two-component sensor histidine kinase [Paenibacillus odorifer]OME32841.1 two-component sensor histidine kinase [Paenibacillus odorifer]OME37577.1 two-component sensor histidine kinase [Paenibacillus odorifer]
MKNNIIGLKLGYIIMSVFLVVLLVLGITIDRMFTSFYYNEMQKETEELTSHFIGMAESQDSSNEQMMSTFAEFSDVSIFNISKDGNVILHSGVHDRSDRSFIQASDVSRIFAGKSVDFEYKDPAGHSYFIIGKPIMEGDTTQSALYVMSSTESMKQSLASIRNLLLIAGIGAFILAIGITGVIAMILSRPLIKMQKATRKIAAGELETRLSIRSNDEIGFLAEAINDLAVDLQRYRDTRQEFLANISHELRTPITYLEGYTKVIKDGLYETEGERDLYLDIIHQEAHRLQHLVDDLFELAKMEEGKVTLTQEWIDLSQLAEQAVRRVELKAKEKGLLLKLQLSGDAYMIRGDQKRMEQIIMNLLENAIRYTDEGEIIVHMEFAADAATLIVEDTGIGIPEEELPYIFERFYRVEKSRSRQYGGSGLGLSIVKKLVELHGGKIRMISQPGAGTRCEVQLLNLSKSE